MSYFLEHGVPESRRINTTAPLAGGGDLSSDLTLSLNTTPLNQPYNAGDFTASGGMTWTVDLADFIQYNYINLGHILIVNLVLGNTTIGGIASTQLFARIPGGFAAAAYSYTSSLITIAGVSEIGFSSVNLAAVNIAITRANGANFPLSVNNVNIGLSITFFI